MPELNATLTELGLTVNPFAAETPLDTLFPGGKRRASLDQLQALSRETSDIVALIGPQGSGKSTLVDFYARRAERDQIVARTRASMLTSPAQLLQEMFKAFVLDFPAQASMAELKAALARYFQSVKSQARSVVLIVDDAHELGDDALSLLVKMAVVENPASNFHLILVGEAALLDMLDYTCPQREGQNQFTSVHLPEFDLDETRNYLRYRLNVAGYSRDDPTRALPFNNRQVDKIHKLAAGVPGRIHQVAGQMLQGGSSHIPWLMALKQITLPRNYSYAAGALLLVLLVAFMFGGGGEQESVPQRQIILSGPQSREAVPVPLVGDQDTPVSAFLAPSVPAPATLPEPETLEPAAVPAPAAVATPEVVTANPAPAPAAPNVPAQVATGAVAQPPAKPAAAAPVRPAAATSAPRPAVAASSPVSARDQILAFPASEYTLQLLGAASKANVESFVQRNSTSPLYWFETRNQGRPWFVVIHGHYPNRAAAQAAASSLRGELGGLEPWIRSLAAVQGDIRSGN